MNQQAYSEVVETAREYYNSADADNFYFHIWGGEDIHIGLYESDDEPIAEASRRTVRRMAELAGDLDADTRVLDLGAGYGGSMRYLAEQFGCRCVALNLSEVENERDREMNQKVGLSDRIDVVDGDFTSLDYPTSRLIWSGRRTRFCIRVIARRSAARRCACSSRAAGWCSPIRCRPMTHRPTASNGSTTGCIWNRSDRRVSTGRRWAILA